MDENKFNIGCHFYSYFYRDRVLSSLPAFCWQFILVWIILQIQNIYQSLEMKKCPWYCVGLWFISERVGRCLVRGGTNCGKILRDLTAWSSRTGLLSLMIEPLCIGVLELELGVKQTAYSAVGPLGGPPCSAQNTVSGNMSSSQLKEKKTWTVSNCWESQQGCRFTSDLWETPPHLYLLIVCC